MKGKFIAILVAIIAVLGGLYTVISITRVGQGEVGVVYTMKDGVQEEVLVPGFHFVGPTAKVKTFPISQQQLVLSNNPADYNAEEHQDWHVDAPADGGMVKMNLTINYNFMSDRVVDLYTKFNGMDGEAIVEGMVQNSIIAYIKEVTPQFSVMDIYSSKRSEVSQAITEYLNKKLNSEYGINIASALIIDVQLDETLQAKIQAKEQAKQDAEKAELDKQTAQAQAEVEKVNAETAKQIAITKAEGSAEVQKIKAEAEAKANQIISQSITPELIQMKEAEARLKHGWVTVQGGTVVTDNTEK
ncbi:prohibitin family protein [Eisenbergiella massiliensis]|jgi:regulator of protease activity HflC (stomatin/prohibitin superfamily)|uniref:Prohibitin family protein n=1 Tax=Eisenbergiella massiliensis TaxID=1720294 RepID=A0A3E3HWH6_9FIRM|nr:prohibitin family protein [Eisenbergiella massiliensis]RGE56157.1 prohibitin family protein [Eisenbergiella massiliensis]DAN95562.1 MAG TPA: High frequency of lysogenization C protein [Caudoviricetes sp.]